MTRAFARSFTAVALATALSLSAVPSASAGSRLFFPGSQDTQTDWLSSAWAWIGDTLGLNYNSGVPKTPAQATESTEVVREIGHTGSCIDPWGNPLPEYVCTQTNSRIGTNVVSKPRA
jgi:hypothetical protein